MMETVFFFRDLQVHGAKVSHNMVVGLPSLTAVVGLGDAFAAKLALQLGLAANEIESAGVLFAYDNYHQHEGYKRVVKPEKNVAEAHVGVWASFTAHIGFALVGRTQRATDKLQEAGTMAQAVLPTLNLSKGLIQNVQQPVALNSRHAAVKLLPSFSLVLSPASWLIEEMRNHGLPLVEGLAAATLIHDKRPKRYRDFFEAMDTATWRLAAVQDGYLNLADATERDGTARLSSRPDFNGNRLPVAVASPTLTLVRLQSAASVKQSQALAPFWSLLTDDRGHFCTVSLPLPR